MNKQDIDKIIEQTYNDALKIIENENVVFFNQLYAYLGISHETFYRYFKKGSEKYETIKRVLNKKKTFKKVKLLKNWEDSENATLQISLYKLLADDDEVARLNNQTINIKQDLPDEVIINVIPKKKDE